MEIILPSVGELLRLHYKEYPIEYCSMKRTLYEETAIDAGSLLLLVF
jgi:hypothetical protein